MPVAVLRNNHYEALNLKPDDASEEEIRIAYKKLALKWHPDRHTNDKNEAQQKFIEISEAYRALLDELEQEKRKKFSKIGLHFSWAASTPSASPSNSSSSKGNSTGSGPQTKMARGDKERQTKKHTHHPTESTSSKTSPKGSPHEDLSSVHHGDSPHSKGCARDPSPRSISNDSSSHSRGDSHAHSASSESKHDVKGQTNSSSSATTEGGSYSHRSSSHLSTEEMHHRPHEHSAPHSKNAPHTQFSLSRTERHIDARNASPSTRKRQPQQWSDDSGHLRQKPQCLRKKSRLDDMHDYEFINLSLPIPPLPSSKSEGQFTKDWIFPLRLSLEDLYHGVVQHYRITRTLRSGTTQSVKIDIRVCSGWRNGTRTRVPGVGNERKDGSFQDIVFAVEEKPHPRFTRVEDDLIVYVQVPWVDAHLHAHSYPPREVSEKFDREDQVYVQGLDGEEFALSIPRTLVEGADGTRIVGAGMPVRKGGRIIGKGDLIVRWEFVFAETDDTQRSRWLSLKKAMSRRL